jgi:signal transduction histidine kinase
MNKPVILCVDDEYRNLRLLEAQLTSQDYEVVLAESGAEGFKKISEKMPDLILLDIMMPEMSGYDFLKIIRADEKTRLIPVVMVTALREVEDRIRSLECGCDDFISKPFDFVELVARVKSLLKISYYRQQLDEKEKLDAVVEKMGDGVIVCTPDWKIRDSNSAARKYLNLNVSSGVFLLNHLFKNFQVSLNQDQLMDNINLHQIFDINRQESKNTKPLYLETNLDRIKNPAGEIRDIVLTLRDVTEKRQEEVLKQDFLSLLSHKLRTPLMVLIGAASWFEEGLLEGLSTEQKQAASVMLKEAYRLNTLFDQLLTFVMVGQKDIVTGVDMAADLNIYIDKLIKQLSTLYPDRKVEIIRRFPQLLTPINIEEKILNFIITSLVDNSVKFNDKEIVRIIISATVAEEGFVTIIFSDNGIGIPSEEYETIFEKFYQIEKNFTGQVEGVGLGLSLVKKLIETAGGSIKVESKLGEGSNFIFTLPLKS